MVFQLFSHKDLYDDNHPDIFKSTEYQGRGNQTQTQSSPAAAESATPLDRIAGGSLAVSLPPTPFAGHHGLPDPESAPISQSRSEDEEVEIPQMSIGLTIGLLAVVTVVRTRSTPYLGFRILGKEY